MRTPPEWAPPTCGQLSATSAKDCNCAITSSERRGDRTSWSHLSQIRQTGSFQKSARPVQSVISRTDHLGESMSRETMLGTVLADLQANEAARLFVDDEFDSDGTRVDWTPKRIKVDWTPKHNARDTRPLAGFTLPAELFPHVQPDRGQSSGRAVDHGERDTPTEQVWLGVERLLRDYVDLRSDDIVIVAYTPESRTAAGWILTAVRARGAECRYVAMRPLLDPDLAEQLDRVLPAPEDIKKRLVIITVENHTMSHVDTFREALLKYDVNQWLVARIIGASADFFTHAMREPKSTISARNTALLERFMRARKMRITTKGGSDLQVVLDSDRFDWISNRGSYRPGGFMVLPPGEVATYPESVDGVFVADGAINVNILANVDARLADNPVRITLRDGRAVDFSCINSEVSEFIAAAFSVPNMTRIGELGFGTNRGIPEFISANTHINERRIGVHLGFGQNNQSDDVVDYQVEMHMDLISDGAMIWLDDDAAPLDLSNVPEPCGEHPSGVLDEDIDGDCCGLWLDDIRAGRRIPRTSAPSPGG
jgi:hypothetical protein